MDDDPEVIRQQMEETRCALTDKIERFEQAVTEKVQTTTAAMTDTVASVREAVQETVETVKGTVSDTVASVTDTFDVPQYFRDYPWAAFGAAVGVGVAGGLLLKGRSRAASAPVNRPSFAAQAPSSNGGGRVPMNGSPAPAQPDRSDNAVSMFDDELRKLKGMAVGAAFSLLRSWIGQSVPVPLADQVHGLIDSVTRKLGGEPVHGDLLESFSRQSQDRGDHARHGDRIAAG
jgi:ElaB/YqjD/DUF883 family membrane-anchored ribosome-binding protein